jgi:hypothetical protein
MALFSSDSTLEFLPAKNGELTLKAQGRFLYSPYDPRSSVRKELRGIVFPSDTVILLGVGLGYLLDELQQDGRIRKIFLVETDTDFYAEVNRRQEIRKDEKTRFLFSKENLQEIAAFDLMTQPKPFILKEKSFSYTAQIVEESEIIALIEKRTTELLTAYRFGMLWYDHLLDRLATKQALRSAMDLAPLVAAHKDCILVIGAGSSLEDSLPAVRKLSHSHLLVCADTIRAYLEKKGIIPDIVVSVDSQETTLLHFQTGSMQEKTHFVFDTLVPQSIIKKTPSEKQFFLRTANPMNRIFPEGIPVLEEGLSFINMSLELLARLGARRILLAGIDLSFPTQHPYTGGNYFSRYFSVRTDRLRTMEMAYLHYMRKRLFVEALDNRDKPVRTTPIMLQYRDALQNYLQRTNTLSVLTLSPCALKIKGIRFLQTEELMGQQEFPEKKKSLFTEKTDSKNPVVETRSPAPHLQAEIFRMAENALLYRWKKRNLPLDEGRRTYASSIVKTKWKKTVDGTGLTKERE